MGALKRLRNTFLLLTSFLVIFSGFGPYFSINTVYAETDAMEKPATNMSQSLKEELEPKQSKETELDYKAPAKYPLIEIGDLAAYLIDDWGTTHTLYYSTAYEYSNSQIGVGFDYFATDALFKDDYLYFEFYSEENNRLEYLGATDFDFFASDSVYLEIYLPKTFYENKEYIYVRVGTLVDPYSAYFTDVESFKVKNPLYTDNGDSEPTLDSYVLISNESVDAESFESTGSFNLQEQTKNIVKDEKLGPGAYRIDADLPFDVPNPEDYEINKNKRFVAPSYKVGQTRDFWVTHMTYDYDYQINARLAYTGSKANVWVHESQITDADAEKLGKEFDNKIYSVVTNNFANESDVDGDGKINILVFDIQDGFDGYYNTSYVAGYFYARDLYNVSYSNKSEIFYIDSYPLMGMGKTKDVTEAYGTIAHEFQHMVSYNQNVLVERNNDLPTWIDEGLAEAANQIYDGKGLSDRLAYYNASGNIASGHSLLYWGDRNDVLSNYSLSYLFMQYVKIQTGQGDKIFKEILQDPNNNYKAVENVAKKYIDPNMTFGELMTNFRLALFLKEPTGLHGFKGDPFFNGLEEKVYFGTTPLNLRGGGAVVTPYNSSKGETIPSNKGVNVTYTFIGSDDEENKDIDPPAKPTVNPVSNKDTKITGKTEANATVTAKVDTKEIGKATSDSNGNFEISIATQKAGTVIKVYAQDKSGNVSEPTSITVADKIPPSKPTVNEVTDKSTTVTGKAEVGSTVEVKANGKLLGSSTAKSDGTFSVKISAQKAGTKLTVTAKDKAGNVSEATTVTVKDATAPSKPTVNEVTDKSTTVTGKADAGSTVEVKANGKLLGSSTAKSDGTFSVKIAAQKAGTKLTVTAKDKAGNVSPAVTIVVSDSKAGTAKDTDNKRIAGASRYHTAATISEYGWAKNSTDTVIIARGDSFPDALAGASLAYEKNAPILLTGDTLHQATKDEIKRLGAKNAIVLGGTAAVPNKVVNELKGLGLKVERVAGSGRYETAVNIANKMDNNADTAILAYGLDFPDALSIAPYAAKNGYPILLTEKDKLSKATQEYLTKNKNIKNIIIVGGTGVINKNVQNQLKGYKVERLAGQHRYDTAAKIANKFGNPSKAYIANGNSFADALTGSVLAAKEGVPLLLVETDKVPYATQNVINKAKINKFTFLGGEAVISEKVKNQLLR